MRLPLFRRVRRHLALGLLPAVLLAQCAPSCTPGGYDPIVKYPLKHDFSLSPGLQPGEVTSCYRADSEVPGRQNMCRVVFGHVNSSQGDTDYYIDGAPWAADDYADLDILSSSGNENDPNGMTIVTNEGYQYEGCSWASPTNNYSCDYRTVRHTVLTTSGSAEYVLRKMWAWSVYAGNTLGCAAGIASVWRGGKITVPLLAGCADGPL